jgi:protein phosphatase
MTVTVEVAAKTDVGCVRQNNEDSFGYDTGHGIFVVCDGMGGMAAGEVASKMAVETVLSYFREGARDGHFPRIGKSCEGLSERGSALASAIQSANEAVHAAAQIEPGHAGMGSTVVAVLVRDTAFSIGHVVDSRIYLLRNGSLRQLTNDHSLVMEQVRRGLITVEEARESDMQNIIIRALGSEESVQPDVDDLPAQPGDILLLCSDGLTRRVPDDKILELITRTPELEQACQQLILAAKDAGGDDNITCMLLRLHDDPWYRRLITGTGPNPHDSM